MRKEQIVLNNLVFRNDHEKGMQQLEMLKKLCLSVSHRLNYDGSTLMTLLKKLQPLHSMQLITSYGYFIPYQMRYL